jgi:hypothetical protein
MSLYNNFKVFKNYPLNQFHVNIHTNFDKKIDLVTLKNSLKKYIMTSEEITKFFHFPSNPKNETSLLKVTAQKLPLPIGVPTYPYSIVNQEVIPTNYPQDTAIIGVSDFRSIRVPIGIHDEDRLRHIYVIGKT